MITVSILNEASRNFESYCDSFKTEDLDIQEKVNLKRGHTLRVIANIERLCTALNLSEEQKYLAVIIAYYHDLGCFSQFIHTRTFSDDNLEDHALLSAKIVEQAGFFPKLDEADQKIVIGAIQNHNKLQLPKIEDEQLLLYTQLVRDADKLDLLEIFISHHPDKQVAETETLVKNLPILGVVADKVIKSIELQKPVKKEDVKCLNDFKLMLMSWVFDLHFKTSFAILNQNRYIEKLYNSLPKQDGIISSYRVIKLFIENKFVEKHSLVNNK